MKERLANLIDVKSIITIGLTATFVFLAIKGDISQDLMNVYMIVITFYFSSQAARNVSSGISNEQKGDAVNGTDNKDSD